MGSMTNIAIGLVVAGTAMSFLNDNYDTLKAGAKSSFAAHKAQRKESHEAVLAERFLGVTRREHLFLDPQHELYDQLKATSDVYDAARNTWDGFAACAFGDEPDWSDAMVRVVNEENGGHAWIGNVQLNRDGTMSGTSIQSDGWSGLRTGRTHRFDKFAVWDWSIRSEGKVYGHYSLRLTQDQLPNRLRAQVTAGLSEEDVPPSWLEPGS